MFLYSNGVNQSLHQGNDMCYFYIVIDIEWGELLQSVQSAKIEKYIKFYLFLIKEGKNKVQIPAK